MPKPYINAIYRYRSTKYDGASWNLTHHAVPADSTDEQIAEVIATSGWECELLGREWPAHTDVGGYPLYYLTAAGGVLSPKSANENLEQTLCSDDPQWFIVACDINYEDPDLYCDDSSERIPSAYAEEETQA